MCTISDLPVVVDERYQQRGALYAGIRAGELSYRQRDLLIDLLIMAEAWGNPKVSDAYDALLHSMTPARAGEPW